MRKRTSVSALLLGGLLGIAGCVNPDAGLPPGSTRVAQPAAVREAPAPAPRQAAATPAPPQAAAAPVRRQGGESFVVRKVRQLAGEADALAKVIDGLEKAHASLRDGARQRAAGYHERVGGIEARLKIGTTRANPRLRAEWRVAQSMLAAMDRDVGAWDVLRTRAAEADSRAAFLNDSVLNAFELSGAVEEDHRALRVIGDKAAHMTVTVTRLLDDVSAFSERQSRLVAAERRELALLAEAIDAGSIDDGVASGPYSARAAEERPLAVIRFDDPNIAYDEALSAAVQQVLDRRPGTTFEIVGISPGGSMAAAADYADKVHRSLRRMGVAASRLRIATRLDGDANVEEVRLYVR